MASKLNLLLYSWLCSAVPPLSKRLPRARILPVNVCIWVSRGVPACLLTPAARLLAYRRGLF